MNQLLMRANYTSLFKLTLRFSLRKNEKEIKIGRNEESFLEGLLRNITKKNFAFHKKKFIMRK